MTPAEVLRAARAKIESPERWCKGARAMNLLGEEAPLTGPDACRWCAAGAVALIDPSPDGFERARALLVAAIPPERRDTSAPIVCFNDRVSTTHADVLNLFDRAIAAAEASS